MNVQIKENRVEIIDQYTKKQILNEYHLLLTSGHAGVNRMTKAI